MANITVESVKNLIAKHSDSTLQPRASVESAKEVSKLIADIDANPTAVAKEVREVITANQQTLHALGAPKAKLTKLVDAFTYSPAGKALDKIKAELVANPFARKFVTDEAFTQAGVTDIKAIDTLIEARGKIEKLADEAKLNEGELKQVLATVQGENATVVTALTKGHGKITGTKIASLYTGVATEISQGVADFKSLAQTVESNLVAKETAIIKAHQAGKTAEDITKIEEQFAKKNASHLKKIEELVTKSDKNPFAETIAQQAKEADEALFEKVVGADKKVGSLLTSAAKGVAAAAEKGRGWTAKLTEFKVTEGYKASQIEKAGSDAGKLVKAEALEIGKFRWGKAALVGLPVVLVGGYLAGIGRNPDKGKYTQMVAANDQVPQQGAVRA